MSKSIIYKRPGSPFFYITGLRKSTGTDKRPLAMEIASHELAKSLKAAKLGDNSVKTWGDLVALWTEEKSHKATWGQDERIIAEVQVFLTRRRLDLLQSIADSDVLEDWMKSVKQRASGSTANRYLNTVRAMFRRALAKKWILHVPELVRYKIEERIPTSLTPDQVRAVIGAIDPKWVPVVKLALLTGMRRANAVMCEWEWINPDRTVITVPAFATKGRRTYTALLNQEARDIIGEHKGSGLVFGRLGAMQNLSHSFKRACLRCGFKAHFHQLRHTWASMHVENGTPDRILMAIGGWASPAMISRYAHFRTEHLVSFADNAPVTDK